MVLDRDLSTFYPVDALAEEEIKEYVTHSWYTYKEGEKAGLHPFKGETSIKYTGPKPPFKTLADSPKYSYIKTPRWKEKPMEVGPLSRMVVGYAAGVEDIKEVVDKALHTLNVPIEAIFSTLGRTAARAIESELVVHYMKDDFKRLWDLVKTGQNSTFNGSKWEPDTWPRECEGVGLTEAPRGALAHYIKIKKGKIENYQMVVPTTWNGSPRDNNMLRSAFEESLIGTPVADVNQPLEIIRTIHSFDPCLACSVHLHDPDGKHLTQIRVE